MAPKKATTSVRTYGDNGSSYVSCDGCGKSIAAALVSLHVKECPDAGGIASKVKLTASEPVAAEKRKTPEKPAKKAAAAAADGGEKKKRGKKNEDGGDKPKRPISGYLRFSATKREELKAQGLQAKEILSKVGEMWNALSAEEKAPFEEAYKKEMEEYKLANPTEPKGKKPKVDKEGKPKAPRAKSGYQLFSDDHRVQVKSENPEFKATDVMKKLAEMWKEADKATIDDYNAQAKKAKDEMPKSEAPAKKAKPAAKKAAKKADSDDEEEKEEEEEEEDEAEEEEDDE